jgi:hypothetical protein
MNMKKLILICAVLVLVQAGLVVLTNNVTQRNTSSINQGALLSLTASEVNELLLEDGDNHSVLLQKTEGSWRLPALSSFPADNLRVQRILGQLVDKQRDWPEATTVEAASRFKVAGDKFERKLTLRDKDKTLKVVYLGSSPGLRKVYLRVDGDPEIHTIAIAPYELEVDADSWIDTRVLQQKPEQVVGVELPGMHLVRQKDGLQLADLQPEEEMVAEKRDTLVKRLAGLTINAVLGKEKKPEYSLDTPSLRYALKLDGGDQIEYVFGRLPKVEKNNKQIPLSEQSYVLKVSNREQLFRVDGWQVDDIKSMDRASLVRTKAAQEKAGQQPVSPEAPLNQVSR